MDPGDLEDETTGDHIDWDTDIPFTLQDNEPAAAQDVSAAHTPDPGPPLTPADPGPLATTDDEGLLDLPPVEPGEANKENIDYENNVKPLKRNKNI